MTQHGLNCWMRNVHNFNFKLGDQVLDIVTHYKYLGVYFSSNGSFLNARKHILDQAKKVMYSFFGKIDNAS